MTRIFTDGAEMGDALFFDGGDTIADTVQKASGDYSYKIGWPLCAWKLLPATETEVYFKQRIRTQSIGTSLKIIEFRFGSDDVAYVGVDSINRLVAMINTTAVESSTSTILDQYWYCMEVYFKLAGINGRFEVKIDDNVVIDYTGDTTYLGGPGAIDNLFWYRNAYDYLWIDDLALNDTAGIVDNSWCGAGRVIKLKPIGDGSVVNAWDGSDGNKVDNWQLVDEIPKDDDTTYIFTDADTPGTLDQYIVEDYDGTDKVIDRIWAECRARKTVAEAAALNIGFYTGASLNVDDVGILNELYDLRIIGQEYLENPDDTDPWEEADLDALEFAVESG